MSTENLTNTEIILKRLKSALDITTDSDLAERLGYSSTGTISMWKKRGEVNYNVILKKIENINIDYLKTGEGKPFTGSQPSSHSANEPAVVYADEVDLPEDGKLTRDQMKEFLRQIEAIARILKDSL